MLVSGSIWRNQLSSPVTMMDAMSLSLAACCQSKWEQTFWYPKVTITYFTAWWVYELSAHCVQMWHFLVGHSKADQWCLCFHLWCISPIF